MNVIKIIGVALLLSCSFCLFSIKTTPKAQPIATHIDVESNLDRELVKSTEKEALDQQPAAVEARQFKSTSTYGVTDFDIPAKRRQVEALVSQGITYLKNNSLDKALNAFTHGKEFIKGELYLFVYDSQGIIFAHGQEANMVWKNMIDLRDPYGTYIVRSGIAKAKEGGGWITYNWRNATKVAYVQQVNKDGKIYIIGSGYYPHSKPDSVMSLVKGAAAYFNEIVNRNGTVDEAFSTLSYPFGRFVSGDLYLYAVRFDGTTMANGDRPGLIGTNVWNVRDAEGKLLNQEIIGKLKETQEGVWTEYRSKNARKLTYSEKVTDKKGTNYFIACGYYPDADRSQVINLVRNGYEFMKKHGLSSAVSEFTDRRKNDFRYGDLYLVVYDMNGVCIAHGSNPDFVGLKQIDYKDEDGRPFIAEMIKKAKAGGGWIDFKLKNAFQSMYVQTIDLGIDTYVIGSGFYPVSKSETALLLVRSAAGVLRTQPDDVAFEQFSNKNSSFMRGDLSVFVCDFNGICRVYGDTYDLIWRNLMDAKDDAGKFYIRTLINTVKQGPGKITYTINGFRRVIFADMVEKGDVSYVVGSGYFE